MLNFASLDSDPGKTLGYWGGLGRRRPFHICKCWWGEFSVFEMWILFLSWNKPTKFWPGGKSFYMRIQNPGDESLSITTSPVVRPCRLDHIRSTMDAFGWSQQVITRVIMRVMVRIDYKSDRNYGCWLDHLGNTLDALGRSQQVIMRMMVTVIMRVIKMMTLDSIISGALWMPLGYLNR